MVSGFCLARRCVLRGSRPAFVLQRHLAMVHRKVCGLLLLVDARVWCRGCGCGRLPFYWAGRVGDAY